MHPVEEKSAVSLIFCWIFESKCVGFFASTIEELIEIINKIQQYHQKFSF